MNCDWFGTTAVRSEVRTGDRNRHYVGDPYGLGEDPRDADERAADDLLEVDQTELAQLGLMLDDPHQPERE